jgi:hypothetical protein
MGMKLKKALAVLMTAPVWLPILAYILFYSLIVNTDKVHKEFEEN